MITYGNIESYLKKAVKLKPARRAKRGRGLSYAFLNEDEERTGKLMDGYYLVDDPAGEAVSRYHGKRPERTSYLKIKGVYVAVKKSSGIKDVLLEAKMLKKARECGLRAATPLRVSVKDSHGLLFKKAGYPDGEIPYCLTDLVKIEEHFRPSKIESHITDALETTMKEFMKLAENGLVHTSISPISHQWQRVPFDITSDGPIRGWDPNINILPTGELKDFEHVEDEAYDEAYDQRLDSERLSTPISEILFSYAWTGVECGITGKKVAESIKDVFSLKSMNKELGTPDIRYLTGLVNDIKKSAKEVVNGTYKDSSGTLPGIDSRNLRRAVRKITRDTRIPKRAFNWKY